MKFFKHLLAFLGLDFEAQARREIESRTKDFQDITDARYFRKNSPMKKPNKPKSLGLNEAREIMSKTRFSI